jgi:hypothetical protein
MYVPRTFAMLVFVGAALIMPPTAPAQVPTADDFLPPVLGGPTDVKQPDKVAMKGDVVTAATAQDAVNVAVEKNVEKLQDNIEEVGARMVQFPSGLGFVATGAAVYRTMENPVATRIAKRKAYVIAFVQAKKNLAEILGGLTNEGKETIREALVNINLPDEEMTNISTESEEALRQAVEMMLRGFVIYEVKDNVALNTVYVSIVTTPKTRGRLARPAPNAVETDDLREGISQVIAEVRSGLVPPVGGRIITMRSTGETAFVGFGSSVVRTSGVRAAQLKLNLEAQKIASMRAKDALCGLMIGDKASWEGSVVDSLKDEIQEFEPLTRDDPLAAKEPTAVRKLEEARNLFVSRLQTSDMYQSVRRGILPPGVNTKTWFDDDHAWAYGMSVYVPSLANAAAGAARQMREGRILQPIDDGSRPRADNGRRGFAPSEGRVDRPGKKVRQGPTGRIEPDEL